MPDELVRPSLALWVVIAITALGCDDSAQMKVYPTSGVVRYKGQALAGAELCFYGIDSELKAPEAPFPKAMVEPDGSFIVSSYAHGDGAPAGSYKVTVVWRTSSAEDPELRDQAADRLRGRYATPDRTDITVEVLPEENRLPPIDLQ